MSVDAAQAATVTHHVEGSWFSNISGADQVRGVRVDADLLVLEGLTPFRTHSDYLGEGEALRKLRAGRLTCG